MVFYRVMSYNRGFYLVCKAVEVFDLVTQAIEVAEHNVYVAYLKKYPQESFYTESKEESFFCVYGDTIKCPLIV